jgi:two-component system sensor histidine kinase KdpD
MAENLAGARGWRWDWGGWQAAVAVVAAATAIGLPLHRSSLKLADTNVLMLYLLGVLWIATRYSRAAAVLASVLGVFAFDFCFVPPYYRLTVHDPQYLVTFAVMLATALLISELTYRVRAHSEAAKIAWQHVETEFLRNVLLSGVSHELRTPLTAIAGAAGALVETRERLSAEAQNELLRTVVEEANRMDRLINNLLDMTRLESGGLAVKKEWQPAAEVIGSALHRMEHRLHDRRVMTNVPADLPLVQIDAVLIEQVLMNLLDNAVEYTPTGSRITVTARQVEGAIEFEVADDGAGLPAGTEHRVFQKFFRAAAPANRRGIGLGLAICRGIVEAHGGKISAANAPAGGAVFRFTIPLTGTPPFFQPTERADEPTHA